MPDETPNTSGSNDWEMPLNDPMGPAPELPRVAPQPDLSASVTPRPFSQPATPTPVAVPPAPAAVADIPAQTSDSSRLEPSRDDLPVAVVQALSVHGVEYAFMTFFLWFVAGTLIGLLLSLFNGGTDFATLSLPLALLLVCVPGFVFFFLRLKKAEVANPALRFDPSKRRLSQFTQVIAFAACVFNVVGLVYTVLQSFGGQSSGSLGKTALNTLVVLVIAGGVLAYYWIDEHRLVK